jgi:hypothetical protein
MLYTFNVDQNKAVQPGLGYLDWWIQNRMLLPSVLRQGFDALVILVAWCLWKETNRRVFHGVCRTATQTVDMVREEADRWSLAGFSHLVALWASHVAA